MRGVFQWTVIVCLGLLARAVPAAAQVSTGEIFGKVTDSTGAVLPGVTVTLASPALIQPQTVATAESGGYRFPSIPIGTYNVSFDLTGFKKVVRSDIIIQAGFNAEGFEYNVTSAPNPSCNFSLRIRSRTPPKVYAPIL